MAPTSRNVVTQLACLLVFLTTRTLAMKDCMEPIRATKGDPLTCSPEFALVPERICNSAQDEKCQDKPMEGSEACAVVVEGLFAEWRMLDAAFLTSGSCHSSMRKGPFSAEDALKLLPHNNELVGVRVKGRHLLDVLKKSLIDYYLHGITGAYPHTAGLKFEFDGTQIKNAKVLTFMCRWNALQEDETYMVLTDSAHADNLFSDAAETSKTGRGVAEAFFLYSTSTCLLKNNWHKMRPKLAPKGPMYPLPPHMASTAPSHASARKQRSSSQQHPKTPTITASEGGTATISAVSCFFQKWNARPWEHSWNLVRTECPFVYSPHVSCDATS